MTAQELFNKIKINPKNPRKISKESFEQLKNSIRTFPKMLELRPIVYDPNEDFFALGGNMRYLALADLIQEGFVLKDEYFKSAENLTESEKREFVIKDNIPNGEWDGALLVKEWGDLPLKEWGLDISKWEKAKGTQDTPPPVDPSTIISKKGKMYQLGEHRLICGDATVVDDIKKLMGGGGVADMIFTDPPYNVDYEGKTKDKLTIENDQMTNDDFYTFMLKSYEVMNEFSKKGAVAYICHSDTERVNFTLAFKNAGWKLAQVVIWAKQRFVMGRQDYHWQHEPILYGWKEGAGHYFVADRTQTTIWNIDNPAKSKEHPTMKPIELIIRALNNNSKEGDIVLDTFGGAGSTLIASQQAGRICYMSEIDPIYCDVIRKRYWKLLNNDNDEGWAENTPIIK